MAQVEKTTAEDKKHQPRTVSVPGSRVKSAEYAQNRWIVNAELGTTIDDIQKPEFLAHVAEQLAHYDHVEVRVDDGSWIAFLIVTACDRNWARVHLLSHHKLVSDTSTPHQSIRHIVDWKGPQHKFCVIRVSDGAKLKTGYDSKDAAYGWLREHERTLS